MEWYFKVMEKYLEFKGRANRQEFWIYSFISSIIFVILLGVEQMADIPTLLTFLYGLIILLPSLAVSVRRLHDTGRSGWWLLISFIPIAGFIILLIFMCLDSEPSVNPYGPKSKTTIGHLAGHY